MTKRKKSQKLGQNWQNGIPIEVLPSAYRLVQETIEKLHQGKAILREFSGAKSKAVIFFNFYLESNKHDFGIINIYLLFLRVL